MDSMWFWLLALLAFVLSLPALRVLGSRVLTGRARTQALVSQPDHISLMRVAEARWSSEAARGSADRQLVGAGFAEAGTYQVREMPGLTLSLYAHPAECAYAMVYDHARSGLWVEFVTRYEDGALATYTTLEPMDVDLPERSVHVAAPQLSPADLWKKMLAERPQAAMRPCDRASAAQEFERGYAESMAYHKRSQSDRRDSREAAAGTQAA